MPHRLDAGDQFNGTSGGNQVTHHAFDAAARNPFRMISENMLNGKGLDSIVDLGAGSVGVDITNIGWIQPGIIERSSDACNGATAFGMAISHPESVGR
mgnify:CR=1 FL=1